MWLKLAKNKLEVIDLFEIAKRHWDQFKSDPFTAWHKGLMGPFYNLTSDPNFQINPWQVPQDASSISDGYDHFEEYRLKDGINDIFPHSSNEEKQKILEECMGKQQNPGSLMVSKHPEMWLGYEKDPVIRSEWEGFGLGDLSNRQYLSIIDTSKMNPNMIIPLDRGFLDETNLFIPNDANVIITLPIQKGLKIKQKIEEYKKQLMMDYLVEKGFIKTSQMANYREIASPPRSEWISRVEFDNDDPFDEEQEDEELFPEYIEGDLLIETFDKDRKRKTYTYPGRNLQEYYDIASTGGHGFWDNNLIDAPFV